jgi:hypothetical protein
MPQSNVFQRLIKHFDPIFVRLGVELPWPRALARGFGTLTACVFRRLACVRIKRVDGASRRLIGDGSIGKDVRLACVIQTRVRRGAMLYR